MNSYPSDWVKVTLGDVGETYSGLSGKSKEDFGQGKYYIPYKNVLSNSEIDECYLEKVAIGPEESQHKVRFGDVLFTTSSEIIDEVGMSSVYLGDRKELYLNSFCFGYRVTKLKSPVYGYLKYLFRSSAVRKMIEYLGQGSTRINLSKKAMMDISIYLPLKLEQEKIASILSSVDRVIDLTEQEISKLKDLKKGMVQDLLTKGIGHSDFKDSLLGRIPNSWDVLKIRDFSTKITNGVVGSAAPYYTDMVSGVPYVRGLNVRPNRFDDRKLVYISKDFHERHTKTTLRSGDLLTVQSGHNGQTCVVPPKYEGANLHAVILTSLNKNIVNPHFVASYINSQGGVRQIEQMITGTTVKHVNTKDFKKFLVPVPSLEEQSEIVAKLEAAGKAEASQQSRLSRFRKLKKALMQDLLTGKVRVKV